MDMQYAILTVHAAHAVNWPCLRYIVKLGVELLVVQLIVSIFTFLNKLEIL